jgi:hypothetical protein
MYATYSVYILAVYLITPNNYHIWYFFFLVLPSSTYLLTAGVEGFCDFI